MLTCYDEIGGYGHPDHIQVHRVGLRAAELAGDAEGVPGDHQPRPHHPADEGDAAARGRRDARLRGRPELRHAGVGHHLRRRRVDVPRRRSGRPCRPTPARSARTTSCSTMPDDAFAHGLRHRSGSSAPGRAPASPRRSCSDDRRVDPHRVRPADRLRRRARCGGCPSSCARSAPGGCCSSRPRAGSAATTATAVARAIGSIAGARPSPRSSRTCRRRPVQAAHRAGPRRRASTPSCPSAAAAAPTSARPSPSSPSRSQGIPSTAWTDRPALPARVDPDDVLGRRAHAVLRDDRPGDAHEVRRRRADLRAGRRRLRPRAHAVDAGRRVGARRA